MLLLRDETIAKQLEELKSTVHCDVYRIKTFCGFDDRKP